MPLSCSNAASVHQKQPPANTAVALPSFVTSGEAAFCSAAVSASDTSLSLSVNLSDSELRQNRRPVGRGPSSNTCPRWPSQRAHRISVRCPIELSACSMTFSFAIGWKKLGQPVPELNLESDANSGKPQPAQV